MKLQARALCGIVDSGSNLEYIEIEVVDDSNLSEGSLVDVKIRQRDVVYQIIDGTTNEDAVQQKINMGTFERKLGK